MQTLAPTQQQTAPAAQKPAATPRLSKALAQAIDMLARGEVKTQKEAAEAVKLTPEHLCRMLAKPHVRGVMHQRASENLARSTLRASARLTELLDAASEHVSLDASKHVLGIAGIRPPETGSNVSVNVGVSVGYVIDLTPGAQQQRAPELRTQIVEHDQEGE
jgi:hypothetical protein